MVSFMVEGEKIMQVRQSPAGLQQRILGDDNKPINGRWYPVSNKMHAELCLYHGDSMRELQSNKEETPDVCPTYGIGCGGCYNCR